MKISKISLAAGLALATVGLAAPAQAQERTLGEIFTVGFNFCPRGSAATDGQLVAISQNTALFSLLGTTFGGDGRTTFAYPDLRGRVPVHQGRGPGLQDYRWGQRGGAETTTLTVANLAAHNHTGDVIAHQAAADQRVAKSNYFARASVDTYSDQPSTATEAMGAGTVSINNTGNSTPFNNRSPFLTVRSCIATQGIFPSRN